MAAHEMCYNDTERHGQDVVVGTKFRAWRFVDNYASRLDGADKNDQQIFRSTEVACIYLTVGGETRKINEVSGETRGVRIIRVWWWVHTSY